MVSEIYYLHTSVHIFMSSVREGFLWLPRIGKSRLVGPVWLLVLGAGSLASSNSSSSGGDDLYDATLGLRTIVTVFLHLLATRSLADPAGSSCCAWLRRASASRASKRRKTCTTGLLWWWCSKTVARYDLASESRTMMSCLTVGFVYSHLSGSCL